MADLMTIREASRWASDYLSRNVTDSNINYLIQYGRIKKINDNGSILLDKQDLIRYYNSYYGKREISWKGKLGDDVNWALSFENYKEKETTKHVHRLHPYKGKFIPQLVEYFLDGHTDDFKKDVFFNEGDIVLDPFCGSGTTLVQANELGIHAIGIDVSAFNALLTNAKISKYDLISLHTEIQKITGNLRAFNSERNVIAFENRLLAELKTFNDEFFPVPEFKYKVRHGQIDGDSYGHQKEKDFLIRYENLVREYSIKLKQDKNDDFLDKWYLHTVREEIDFAFNLVRQIKDPKIKKIVAIILSRTIRSCRATTHADLATLKEPVYSTYYCAKHGKICKPLFSILKWWESYCKDTINRLSEFNRLRTDTYQYCITGDSRNTDIIGVLSAKRPKFAELVETRKIAGIFSSPPYVGLIDYHEQHAYAYDLFGFDRNDESEIGPLFRGQGKQARESYIEGIAKVLINSKRYLCDDYDVFLVANDKYGVYPTIAEKAGMKIVNKFIRPVLNRTERDKNAYAETIFHLSEE